MSIGSVIDWVSNQRGKNGVTRLFRLQRRTWINAVPLGLAQRWDSSLTNRVQRPTLSCLFMCSGRDWSAELIQAHFTTSRKP
jgi:hypothetical protein